MEASLARTVLEAAPVCILAVDAGGTVCLANPTALGFWQDDLVVGATSLWSLLPRFELETMVPGERRHKPVSLRASIGGNDKDLVVFSVPFDSPKGHLTALFIRDETERVQTEHALERLRNEVLLNWQLNSLGELAALVGHEISQPLAAMTTLLHIAREELQSASIRPEVLEALEGSIAQAYRASDIIRRFRALLSRETQYHSDVPARRLVADIEPLLQLQARDATFLLTIHVEEASLRCDAVQIHQVLLNLVRNALMHGRTERNPAVSIFGQACADAYRFEVTDNGPGFVDGWPSFDPQPPMDGGTGMGLGLAICRRIVEAHGGSITASNMSEGGARVSFQLPYGTLE